MNRPEMIWRGSVLAVLITIAVQLWIGNRELRRLHADMPEVSGISGDLSDIKDSTDNISSMVDQIQAALP